MRISDWSSDVCSSDLLAVRITTADTVLEPSAGTGLLAVFASRAGAKLVLNEIDPGRADMLQAAFPTAPVRRHDGELIDDLLPLSLRPTVGLIQDRKNVG